jgi:hypothetical protein
VTEDPEKIQKEAEKLEKEKIKYRRKIEAQRQRSLIASEGLDTEALEYDSGDPANRVYRKGDAQLYERLNEYNTDDGFIVDDEESSDEEERIERIRAAKRNEPEGSDEPDDMSEASLTSNPSQQATTQSLKAKKLRIVEESDEED